MADASPTWGSPRIHGELLKLGIKISERTVARLMPKKRYPPSQTWRTFLDNHVRDLVSIDFFVVPTATFRVLFVPVVLAHDRRRVVHFNITEHPSARWTGEQIIQAFPDGSEPRYLLRDRDRIYGEEFQERIQAMGIKEVSGEGVLGMSWAFFVAGCPTTVVSQWSVETNSTSELMVHIHRALRAINGTSARLRGSAEALRQAALAMLKTPGYANPFYWAGFIVLGAGW
jgi:hypothetical protein